MSLRNKNLDVKKEIQNELEDKIGPMIIMCKIIILSWESTKLNS